MSRNGKGAAPRPLGVARQHYLENWDATFGQEAAGKEITRLLTNRGLLKKRGRCELCGDDGGTTWHHRAPYEPGENPSVEVCQECKADLQA